MAEKLKTIEEHATAAELPALLRDDLVATPPWDGAPVAERIGDLFSPTHERWRRFDDSPLETWV